MHKILQRCFVPTRRSSIDASDPVPFQIPESFFPNHPIHQRHQYRLADSHTNLLGYFSVKDAEILVNQHGMMDLAHYHLHPPDTPPQVDPNTRYDVPIHLLGPSAKDDKILDRLHPIHEAHQLLVLRIVHDGDLKGIAFYEIYHFDMERLHLRLAQGCRIAGLEAFKAYVLQTGTERGEDARYVLTRKIREGSKGDGGEPSVVPENLGGLLGYQRTGDREMLNVGCMRDQRVQGPSGRVRDDEMSRVSEKTRADAEARGSGDGDAAEEEDLRGQGPNSGDESACTEGSAVRHGSVIVDIGGSFEGKVTRLTTFEWSIMPPMCGLFCSLTHCLHFSSATSSLFACLNLDLVHCSPQARDEDLGAKGYQDAVVTMRKKKQLKMALNGLTCPTRSQLKLHITALADLTILSLHYYRPTGDDLAIDQARAGVAGEGSLLESGDSSASRVRMFDIMVDRLPNELAESITAES
ncbi:uncharacterized protein BT62DRAFT_1012511 [Guyanagaster necrorhizus]|uniref:Uncharacterized protein n=1 Tax=Guyanagaster necrorhizus TaxID=856835 RepID=A0A9P8AN69_9AGAR|nr:uncharacterized protein BT62DRAFT_1012511 [Guyanagaster necrorhizus MCA 3950]KAG7440587.1 hypothetical protein BT62DRAFT_1012511 [Guyanagaster necrorhizus MCA 3950]